MKIKDKFLILFLTLSLTSCGDFPEYQYDKSESLCVMTFPFAAGLINRQYIGYFNIISTLQFIDADPEIKIYVGGPSHIDLEIGSLQYVEINDKYYHPEFRKNYFIAELHYWGPAFLFSDKQADEIYAALQDGNDISFVGRIEIGRQYETQVYNFSFDDKSKPFNDCVNQLLEDGDMERILERRRKAQLSEEVSS
ncbi:MAG: hypothetical protein OEY19_00595 [Gammaproteobacteria bacterium]|nr:hypothetical protein [Gammaproteobacteria bacterium]MDH5628903.1 hypothetical protein [Gammaproteobacteria bacterium]